jgi:hypothetical protein
MSSQRNELADLIERSGHTKASRGSRGNDGWPDVHPCHHSRGAPLSTLYYSEVMATGNPSPLQLNSIALSEAVHFRPPAVDLYYTRRTSHLTPS